MVMSFLKAYRAQICVKSVCIWSFSGPCFPANRFHFWSCSYDQWMSWYVYFITLFTWPIFHLNRFFVQMSFLDTTRLLFILFRQFKIARFQMQYCELRIKGMNCRSFMVVHVITQSAKRHLQDALKMSY